MLGRKQKPRGKRGTAWRGTGQFVGVPISHPAVDDEAFPGRSWYAPDMRKRFLSGGSGRSIWLSVRHAVGPAILVISLVMFVRFSLLYARAIRLAETMKTS